MSDAEKEERLRKFTSMERCFLLASISTAWTLWLRIEELFSLRYGFLESELSTAMGSVFFNIRVPFRKTHQMDADGQLFEVHPQPDLPAADMYTFVNEWIRFCEECLGKALEPDDFLFPNVARQKLQPGRRMSRGCFSTLFQKLCRLSGIAGNNATFSLHCFRRGGAQHRFILSDKKWSLAAVKFWGGWSPNESVETIMKYLLEERQGMENSYHDMLSPVRDDRRHSLQSANTESNMVTVSFLTEAFSQVMKKMDEATNRVQHSIDIAVLRGLGSAVHRADIGTVQTVVHMRGDPVNCNTVLRSRERRTDVGGPSHVLRIPRATTWKDVIEQWHRGQPQKGLTKALKLWTTEERNEPSVKKVYSERRTVAEELERLGETAFVSEYAENLRSIRKLLVHIRENRRIREDE
jgi:hypothetical protein